MAMLNNQRVDTPIVSLLLRLLQDPFSVQGQPAIHKHHIRQSRSSQRQSKQQQQQQQTTRINGNITYEWK